MGVRLRTVVPGPVGADDVPHLPICCLSDIA